MSQQLSKAEQNRRFVAGYHLAFETKSNKKKWIEIFNLWHSAASGGYLRAQFYLATCYDNGYGVQKNVQKAFE
jgi:TPR repeat protein